MRTELAGSKAFPLERMLSIFEAIVDREYDYASQSVDVLMQVSSISQRIDFNRLNILSSQPGYNSNQFKIVAKSLSERERYGWNQVEK